MRLTLETKIILTTVLTTIGIVAVGAYLFSRPPRLPTVVSRTQLIPPGTPTKGNPDSPNYLVEFSDFQCPTCRSFKPVVDQLLEKYSDNLQFAYRHFPLPQHPFAQKAAYAAQAAHIQQKFWEMHDYLFVSQDNLGDQFIEEAYKEIGLSRDQYQSDLMSDPTRQKITTDLADGTGFGVDSTPTFFLNGKKLTLTTFTDLITEVERVASPSSSLLQ